MIEKKREVVGLGNEVIVSKIVLEKCPQMIENVFEIVHHQMLFKVQNS
jgi:hypothetical protein